jgi:hypothetical protein
MRADTYDTNDTSATVPCTSDMWTSNCEPDTGMLYACMCICYACVFCAVLLLISVVLACMRRKQLK